MPKKLAYRQNKSFLTLNLLVRKKRFYRSIDAKSNKYTNKCNIKINQKIKETKK